MTWLLILKFPHFGLQIYILKISWFSVYKNCGSDHMKKKLIIDKISTEKHILGSAKINHIWNFLKTVKIRIPILHHQIRLECQISYPIVKAPTLLDDLTPKTASEYHKKSLKQRVESNFFKWKTLYIGSFKSKSLI